MKNKTVWLALAVLAALLGIAWGICRKQGAVLKRPVAICGKTN